VKKICFKKSLVFKNDLFSKQFFVLLYCSITCLTHSGISCLLFTPILQDFYIFLLVHNPLLALLLKLLLLVTYQFGITGYSIGLFKKEIVHVESRPTVYSYLVFGLKISSFRLSYQRPSSSADCARELFQGSNGSASLVDCTRKKFFWLGCADFS